jgi:hypothetical protein
MLENLNEQFFSVEFEEGVAWDEPVVECLEVTSKFGDCAKPRPNGFSHIRNLLEKLHKA